MVGRAAGSILIMLMIAFFLSETFPGRRSAPIAPTTAIMMWHTPTSTAPRSFDEITDLATCQEMQRQIAQQHDTADGQITLACRPSQIAAMPL